MNKALFKIALILLGFGLVFSSCSKDDDEGSGSFTYKDKKYTLSQGTIEAYGYWDAGVYNLDLYLYSSDFDLEDRTGTGEYLYFNMFSNKNTDLTAGTYTYDYLSEVPFTFDYGKAYLDFNMNSYSGTVVSMYDGDVTISKSGSTYTINIDCEDASGEKIVGTYKGSIDYYDYSDKKVKTPRVKK